MSAVAAFAVVSPASAIGLGAIYLAGSYASPLIKDYIELRNIENKFQKLDDIITGKIPAETIEFTVKELQRMQKRAH